MFISLIDAESFKMIIFMFLEATFRVTNPQETRLPFCSLWEGKLLYPGPNFFKLIYWFCTFFGSCHKIVIAF